MRRSINSTELSISCWAKEMSLQAFHGFRVSVGLKSAIWVQALNRAVKAIPTEPILYITAAKLQEAHGDVSMVRFTRTI